MSMSPEEKALAETAYRRVQSWRKGADFLLAVIIFGQVASYCPMLARRLHDPGIPIHELVMDAGLLGAVLSACIFTAFFLRKQRQRDEKLICIFERKFPDECSWKQEEKILAEVEDLRLKAKADLLIHQGVRSDCSGSLGPPRI